MQIKIEIDDDFVPMFKHDRFNDSLLRLFYSSFISGDRTERELVLMLMEAFKKGEIINE